MKKIVALLLALCMVLTMTAALAESRSYVMVGVTDADGNTVVSDEIPVLCFALNDETMVCAFGTEEETMEGVAEIAGVDEESKLVILNVTLADETTIVIYFDGDSDTMSFVDEDGFVYTMVNVETLAEAA